MSFRILTEGYLGPPESSDPSVRKFCTYTPLLMEVVPWQRFRIPIAPRIARVL